MHTQEKSTEFSNAFSNIIKGKMYLKNIGYTIKQTIILHFKYRIGQSNHISYPSYDL